MSRANLFVAVAGLIVLLAFTFSRLTVPRRRPVVRVSTASGDVVEYPVTPGRANVDPTLGGFLRTAMVAEDAYFAESGGYTSDVRMLHLSRPANTQLYVVRVGEDGLRMSAINSRTGVQCDVFAGDSARWAFGYAFDPHRPRCGKVR